MKEESDSRIWIGRRKGIAPGLLLTSFLYDSSDVS